MRRETGIAHLWTCTPNSLMLLERALRAERAAIRGRDTHRSADRREEQAIQIL